MDCAAARGSWPNRNTHGHSALLLLQDSVLPHCSVSEEMSTHCHLPVQMGQSSIIGMEGRLTLTVLPKLTQFLLHHMGKTSKMNPRNMAGKGFAFILQAGLWFIQKELRLLNFLILLSFSSASQPNIKRYLLIICWLIFNQKKSPCL